MHRECIATSIVVAAIIQFLSKGISFITYHLNPHQLITFYYPSIEALFGSRLSSFLLTIIIISNYQLSYGILHLHMDSHGIRKIRSLIQL